MTVSVRPGQSNAPASDFLSGIGHELLAGERARCPVPPDTEVALCLPRKTAEAILLPVRSTTRGGSAPRR